MWNDIEERTRNSGEYIAATGCTVRACAAHFGTSKSTVHKDVTERLQHIDPALYKKVHKVLSKNLSERHLRGGDATKKMYERRRNGKSARNETL